MTPDHARKRLDAFTKVLKNAGLGDAAVSRVAELAGSYEAQRGGPPFSQDEVLSFVRSMALPTEPEKRQAEAFLGAYLVFNIPSSGINVSLLIQGLLSIEPETVITTAQKALAGEGPFGRFATRTIGFFTREAVRQWLAPIGAVAIFVIAFLEMTSLPASRGALRRSRGAPPAG